MKDPIERQDAIDDTISRQEAMETAENVAFAVDEHGSSEGWLAMLINSLEVLPSAQPEIIRCKDCKWHNGEINQCKAQICASMCSDDFCSRAERWEDG